MRATFWWSIRRFFAAILQKLRPRKNPAPIGIIILEEKADGEPAAPVQRVLRKRGNMQTLEELLNDYMVENGVDPGTAGVAAAKCARAVQIYGAGGAAIGATAGYMTANPATLLMAAFGGASGATIGMLHSPSCAEVRSAARRWANTRM